MSRREIPPESEITALGGYRFPGGAFRVDHWENVLLTGCTGAELLPDGQVHPVALFHLPIQGAGTSIAGMFALGQAESDLSIMIESYDWEMHQPLQESTDYRVAATITSAERRRDATDRVYDRIQFRFDVSGPAGEAVATSTITWHYTRNTP
jgi:hypothetical protein